MNASVQRTAASVSATAAETAHELLERAMTAYKQSDEATAKSMCRAALELNPARADGWTLLGMLLRRAGNLDDAVAAYETAVAHQPDYGDAHNNIANIRREQRRTTEAIVHYRRALECKPNFISALHNLGTMLDQHEGQAEEALACFDRALALDPGNANIRWDRALALLSLGRFEEGFAEYESRWERRQPAPRELDPPQWQGEPLNGKTILVYTEQGFGDTLQFMRFLPAVAASGGRIVLEAQSALCSLLAVQAGVETIIEAGAKLPPFDCHVALMSIAHIIGADQSTLRCSMPYLAPPADRLAAWAQRIPREPLLKVGLVWGGNPNVRNDAIRSPRLAPLRPLFDVPGVRFYFLQKGPARDDLANVALPPGYVDLNEPIQDFADTAAAIRQLDLVISSDTSVAHLAGALGVPVWLLAQYAPDWRWSVLDDGTPRWYPTARRFRQPEIGRWDVVVDEVRTALVARAKSVAAL